MTRRVSPYILFPLGTLAVGLLIGFLDLPGDWYAQLRKPSFNPPPWIFGPIWSVLYAMIGVAGARLWTLDRRGRAMGMWVFQIILNFVWSPLFFRMHRIDLAFADILGLLVVILGFMVVAWREDRVASGLFAPYVAWVGFAAVLNGAILLLN